MSEVFKKCCINCGKCIRWVDDDFYCINGITKSRLGDNFVYSEHDCAHFETKDDSFGSLILGDDLKFEWADKNCKELIKKKHIIHYLRFNKIDGNFEIIKYNGWRLKRRIRILNQLFSIQISINNCMRTYLYSINPLKIDDQDLFLSKSISSKALTLWESWGKKEKVKDKKMLEDVSFHLNFKDDILYFDQISL